MGKRIGQYEIKKTLGSWKGVSCHLGVHRSSQKKAVLKVLVKDAAPGHSENCLSLLRGEAELSSSLDFPGIVPILETGEVPEGIYVAMGYESGPTLETFLKEKAPLSPEQAAFLGLEIAKALAHGHGRGIFHRNLKTSNIFLRKGPSAAVADFSLARAPDPMDPASTGVAFSRHPRFLAPEQVRGDYDMVDQRTDIYSLGVVLYEMLTGQDPFEGDKPGSIQYKILKTTPRPPRAVVRSVPKDLDAITRKCMQRQIHLRYWSMAEAALDLMRFLEGKPVSALEGQSLGGKLRVAARGRRGVVIAAVAAGALGLAAFLMLQSGGKAPEPAAEGRAAVRDHGGGKDEGSLRKKLKAALTNGLAQGVLNRRIEALRAVLAEAPDYAPALAHLGFTEVFAGRILHGVDLLAKASERGPDLPSVRYFWGFVYIHYLNAEERGLVELVAVAEGVDRSALTHMARAWLAWLQRTDFNGAIEALSDAQEKGAATWEISFLLGFMYQTASKPKPHKALGEYRIVGQETGGFPPALFQGARIFLEQGDRDRAKRNLELVRRIAPEFPAGLLLLSRLLMEDGNWGEAEKRLSSALVVIPDSVEILVRRAECRLHLGRPVEGIEDADQALAMSTKNAEALLVRAQCHAARKEVDAAERDFLDAIKADSTQARYPFTYALFLENIGSAAEAVDSYSRAIKADSDYLEAYKRRAYLYFTLKDFDSSLADYQTVLRLDPTVVRAYIGAAYIYFHRKRNVTMARDYLRAGLRFCAKDPKVDEIRRFLDIVNQKK